MHALLCAGTSAHDVYRQLYLHLKRHGVGKGVRTFVYPEWIREVVRARFSTPGNFDAQYDANQDCYLVTAADLEGIEWSDDCDDCAFCSIPMPSTP